ncbi:MAG: teichoic acid D-Ala incorporation-associated protein DltX [Candidatus Paralactobacillus gallistercoris]|uniref:Teichoic acid D-Ala incorporation-associated protein DltX n=1 Tax=Candidatus Paralactobacillus gallistercoris TaxID=2838724 RepID=A0A948TJB0_9LACO|nr:teichoic acid D-Ala incorporation-associated protein DltX [Candidatus Paralactobacillus gallistercoris]
MLKKLKKLWHNSTFQFIFRIVFYFAILMVLVYLYSYSGVNNSKFIYNEF